MPRTPPDRDIRAANAFLKLTPSEEALLYIEQAQQFLDIDLDETPGAWPDGGADDRRAAKVVLGRAREALVEDGARVELVMEALDGKRRWMRKRG